MLTETRQRQSTKDRIIDAAEELFAERGFVETSLRVITSRANVNLASVNYHFGSKKSLIQAVFDRYLSVFFSDLQNCLSKAEDNNNAPDVRKVLQTMVEPLLSLDNLRPNGTSVFMHLIGRAYSETQGHIRRFMMDKYAPILDRFYKLIYVSLPCHSPHEVFLRLHFTMGAVVFTFAGNKALSEISQADFEQTLDVREIAQKLIPYLAAGLEAPCTDKQTVQQEILKENSL